MKRLLFLSVFFCATLSHAQNSEPYSFSEIVKISDSTKSAKELYANAKMWFVNSFKDPREVIILNDVVNNTLVGRGNMRYLSKIFTGSVAREGWISFDTQITCKKGRYKYTFSNFIHEGNSINLGLVTNDKFLPTMKGFSAGGPEKYKIKVTNELRDIIKQNVGKLIETLEKTMEGNIQSKEEW